MDYKIKRKNSPTDDDILEDAKKIMQKLGRSSITIKEYDTYGSYNSTTAIRKFGSWYNALDRFEEYINKEDKDTAIQLIEDKGQNGNNKHKTKREPSDRLKVQVLMRDGNRCRICGAKCDGGIHKLHFDHIIPWAKGGETTLDNLQVLCSVCNAALGDVDK